MRSRVKAALAASVLLVLLSVGVASADTPPTVTIGAPSDVTYTTAMVNGTIDPNGGPSDTWWYAQFSTDETNWSAYGGGNIGSGSGPVPVQTKLANLEDGTQYYVRIVAYNAGGETISAPPNPSFTTPVFPAPEASIEPVQLEGADAHFAGSVDPNGIPTRYRFELAVDDGTPDWIAYGKGKSESEDPVAIEADAEGLTALTDYLVRVTVESNGGTVSTSEESFSIGTAAPGVRILPGSERTTTGVRLNATINPNGLPTEYRFEWGTSTAYGNVIPSSGGDAYAGQGTETARYSKPVSGLAPSTTIHYRVIAHNADGTTTSPDQTVVTLAQPVAYEMVSPPDKEGSNLLFCCGAQASSDGERAEYLSAGVFAGGQSNLQLNPYLSRRGADNWSTEFLPLPQTTKNGGFTNGGTQGFSPELTKVFQFSRDALLPGAVVDNSNMYQRDLETGELRFIATFEDNGFGMGLSDSGIFQGSTADGDHMVFHASKALTPDAIEGGSNFYDYTEGEPHLVSVLPDGTAANAESIGPGKDRLKYNQVSPDGSRIFFVANQALYVREDNATTRLISASQRTGDDPTEPRISLGAWASADGSTIYFIAYGSGSAGHLGLTDDAPPFFGEATGQLYRYDLESGDLTYIPFGSDGPADTNFVERLLGVSADGSTVYFSGGHSSGESASFVYPHNRLYVSRNGQTHFIGETDPALQERIDAGAGSPDGRYFAFTGFDPGVTSPPSRSCAGCAQIYVYDNEDQGAGLVCASCNPGRFETSNTELDLEPEENTGGYMNRVLLDNGDLFFQSEDRLVPEDTNDKTDVYRWNAGQLDLISRGYGKENSFYADATPDGSSVFFYTGEHLVTQDFDSAQDLYVARVNGGLSGQNPPLPEQPCFGEGCLDRSPNPPGDVTPGSNGFHGPVNPKPRFAHKKRCGKGKVRKVVKGKKKCVKRKARNGKGGGK